MSNLTKFQDAAIQNAAEVKGGTLGFLFGHNSCAPRPTSCGSYNAPQSTSCGSYYAPQPTNNCAPKPVSNCAPKPTFCLPKISFSFGFGGC